MKRTALAAFATLAIALPCASMPLGMRLAARAAAAQSHAETDEERAYRIYAPCSAFEVTVTNGATFAVNINFLSGHSSVTVDWGDGTTSTHTSSPASHAYAADGSFVVKLSDDISKFELPSTSKQFVTAALRWGDSVTDAGGTYNEAANLAGFVPRWGKNITDVSYGFTNTKVTGRVPEWNDKIRRASTTYGNCTGLTGRVPEWNDVLTFAWGTFSGCTGLTGSIPAWGANVEYAYGTYSGCTGLTGEIPAWGANVANAYATYSKCTGLTGEIPAWNNKITDAGSTYANCTGLTGEIPAWNDKITYAGSTYGNCTGLTGEIPAWNDKITDASTTYYNCTGLTGEIPAWNDKITNARATYAKCTGLTGEIPAWGAAMTDTGPYGWNGCYAYCTGLTGAWTDDPALLMPTNITSHAGTVYCASDELRALFYKSWGGSLDDPVTE